MRKCSDLVHYDTMKEAQNAPYKLGVSESTAKEYRAVRCQNCDKWHLLHISYELETFE
jgi:hypothetical protein